jgi:tRNA(Ile)-lysidine synthase
VCHLNHRLRGRASAGDAAFVQRLADSLGLPAEIGTEEVRRTAKLHGRSLETAGREARHRFFHECARRHRCRRVVMAHHANDQVETVLFNLCRGAGGLKGMKPLSTPGRLTLLRPLLSVTRGEIDAYITAHALRFREDATNAEPDTSRNRMRLEVMPALARALGRDVVPPVLRALEILDAEDAYLDQQARALLQDPTLLSSPGDQLRVPRLRDLPAAMQRRVIRVWMEQWQLPGIGFDEVESARAMLQPGGPCAVNLPGNRFLRRSRGLLILER